LISGTLPSLSLAGNKRLKAGAWRLLAVFMKRVSSSNVVVYDKLMGRQDH
jgi:protein phosphatase 1 regulatory subunit 37